MRADKSLSPFEIRLYRHYRIVHGIRIALAFILTFLLVRLFNIPEGTWPLITLVGADWWYDPRIGAGPGGAAS